MTASHEGFGNNPTFRVYRVGSDFGIETWFQYYTQTIALQHGGTWQLEYEFASTYSTMGVNGGSMQALVTRLQTLPSLAANYLAHYSASVVSVAVSMLALQCSASDTQQSTLAALSTDLTFQWGSGAALGIGPNYDGDFNCSMILPVMGYGTTSDGLRSLSALFSFLEQPATAR